MVKMKIYLSFTLPPTVSTICRCVIINHQEHTLQSLKAEELGQENDYSKKTGINGFPAILKLMTLRVPESFPLDIMHLLYQGVISCVLMPLFAGNFWKEGSPFNHSDRGKTPRQIQSERSRAIKDNRKWIAPDDDGLQVPAATWKRIGKDLAVCIPKLFNYFADTSCH